MKVLFMVPIRSGSKGVKNKNIKKLNGIPLIAYIINSIKKSKAYQNGGYLFVNTDSEEYANIAEKLGASIPFLRPKYLAQDSSVINETIKFTLSKFEEMNMKFDVFAMLQATSPFTQYSDIDKAIKILENESNIETVSSVTETEYPPVWCNTLDNKFSMYNFIPKNIRQKNRQKLPKYYKVTGAIRMARWNSIKENDINWYSKSSKALIVKNEYSLDIDTEEDFRYAEFLMNKQNNK